MSSQNICLHCGACCAFFRVSFYWGEADQLVGGRVPPGLVEEETEFFSNMKGTNQRHPYCAALCGKIGQEVTCTIYENRPSPCDEFGIHYQNDIAIVTPDDLERCNRARAGWDLPPLSFADLMPVPSQGGTSRPAGQETDKLVSR